MDVLANPAFNAPSCFVFEKMEESCIHLYWGVPGFRHSDSEGLVILPREDGDGVTMSIDLALQCC